MILDEEVTEIVGPVESYKTISDQLKSAGILVDEAGLRMMPNQELDLEIEQTIKVMKVIDAIEELDDVQDVYSNLKISNDAMAVLEAG